MQDHTTRPAITPTDRFWKYVDAGALSDCWEWTGATRNGYGVLRINRKTIYAHRFCYELHYGPIPEGKEVCHNCPDGDNRLCTNPYHLFLGTHRDNIQDMYSKGRGKGGSQKGRNRTTLVAQDVREIRKFAAEGVRYPAIAKQFGVSISAISMIVTRKRWGHVS